MTRTWLFGRLLIIGVCIAGAIWTASRLPSVSTTDATFELARSQRSGFRAPNQYLYRLQGFLHPTLESNRKSLPGRTGPVTGFGAGEAYPQIWLRDSATLVPVTRFHYPTEHLTSWLEEHLSHQRPDGQLYDWIAAGAASHFANYAPRSREVFRAGDDVLSADKNTVEADQETSAVIAAHEIYSALGDPAWLQKDIEGERLVDRLSIAMDYLVRDRLDRESGLVVSGFTADWGDVSPVYPDARALYLDEKTPRVLGLYTNCLFYEASRRLGEMYDVLGEEATAAAWHEQAEVTKARINEHLWKDDEGFYRIHQVLNPKLVAGWPEDSHIFAMGGNALATLYGIADENQARRIFDRVEQRRTEVGMSTVSGALLPAYPAGFFAHPLMREPYSYQNGGQWDWFGGRLVLAEFERGFSVRAREHLLEIARKVTGNGGLHEWHTPSGAGRGSARYAGSAGALGAASFRGLFGVYLEADRLEVTVRLGTQPGQISLYEPATDRFVLYRYDYDASNGRMRLRFETSEVSEGRLSLLLPEDASAETVWIDGQEEAFATRAVGEDRFVEVTTDWSSHLLRVQLN